nr:DRTGG domain-containing protein [uncultured Ruminococcus sp.]
MTVKDLIEKLDLKVLVEDDFDREVTDCYVGDLLSWVMGRAPADSAWLTVMGNINSIAVATLADCACIILVENAALDDNAREKADMHGVNILTTPMNSYKLAVEISKLI